MFDDGWIEFVSRRRTIQLAVVATARVILTFGVRIGFPGKCIDERRGHRSEEFLVFTWLRKRRFVRILAKVR